MKKFLAAFLAAIMVFAMLTTSFAAATPYDEYTKISGKIERDGSETINPGDKFKVNISVNFNDSTPIEKITAFHLIGNCSDNLKISGFDFCDTSKKPSNTISSKMKDQKIDYTSAAMPSESFITAEDDGYGKLIWIEFEAVSGGEATIHLDGSYIRTSVEDLPDQKRCLNTDDLKVTVASDSGSSEDNGESSGSSSSKPSGSKNNGGSVVVTPTPDTPKTDEKTEENNGGSAEISYTFADVANDHWAYEFAKDLFDKKIISGAGKNDKGEIILNPDSAITREEAVKIAVAAADFELNDNFELTFGDATEISDWARAYVFAGFEYGILKGYDDNTFRPKNKITREELAKVIVGTFGIEIGENADVSQFSDADKITWSAPYIAAAVENGIIKGYDDNSVKPQSFVTRIEAITMFGRAIKLLNK